MDEALDRMHNQKGKPAGQENTDTLSSINVDKLISDGQPAGIRLWLHGSYKYPGICFRTLQDSPSAE